MSYADFIKKLNDLSESTFAGFQQKLIPTKQTIIGVRTPVLRKIAKEYLSSIEELLTYPDEYYEVTFIKLTAVALLPYERFIERLEYCVDRIDNWATCDSFKAKCIQKNKEKFLLQLDKLFQTGKEYYQRYVLVTLLGNYIDQKYLSWIQTYVQTADVRFYYVHMAVAWLVAEVLIKNFDEGITLLQTCVKDAKTRNKAIQKAKESYRLTQEQKTFLETLKIK